MVRTLQQYDVVALAQDVPKHGLVRGQVGTIVEQYASDAFEVEFVDDSGRTYALVTLNSSQLTAYNEAAQAV